MMRSHERPLRVTSPNFYNITPAVRVMPDLIIE